MRACEAVLSECDLIESLKSNNEPCAVETKEERIRLRTRLFFPAYVAQLLPRTSFYLSQTCPKSSALLCTHVV